jgi:hypothetical protein
LQLLINIQIVKLKIKKIQHNKQPMKAIEATGKIDAQGQLSVEVPLNITQPRSVRVIILLDEGDEPEADQPSDESLKIQPDQGRNLMPEAEFRSGFTEALAEAGYDSRDKILQLVQEVKREIATERENQKNL